MLGSILQQHTLDGDGPQTVLCEIEAIPLTSLSEGPNDREPLMPNHIFFLKSKPALPPRMFVKVFLCKTMI